MAIVLQNSTNNYYQHGTSPILPASDWVVGVLVRMVSNTGTSDQQCYGFGNVATTPSIGFYLRGSASGTNPDKWRAYGSDGTVTWTKTAATATPADGRLWWLIQMRDTANDSIDFWMVEGQREHNAAMINQGTTNISALGGVGSISPAVQWTAGCRRTGTSTRTNPLQTGNMIFESFVGNFSLDEGLLHELSINGVDALEARGMPLTAWHRYPGALDTIPDLVGGNHASKVGTTITSDSSFEPVARRTPFIIFLGNVSGGADVTVSPAAISAAATTANPTVVLGGLSITPAAISMAATTANPTVVLGQISVTPAANSSAATTADPTVILGSVAVAPSAVSAQATTVDPAVLYSSTTASPAAIAAQATTVDPSVVLSSQTVAPVALAAQATTVDPSVALGSLALTPSAIEAAATT